MSEPNDNATQQESQQQPAVNAELEAYKAQIAAEQARTQAELESYKQTLAAIQGQVGGGQPAPMQIGQFQVPPQIIQGLRARGLQEREIQDAAALILPFLETYGAPILNQLQLAQMDNQFLKAERNRKDFPKWDVVADTIEQLRADAAKQGRLLDPKTAYQWAMGIGYDKVKEAEAAESAAAARARDASINDLAPSPRLRLDTEDRTLKSADDIVNMTDDDVSKFIDKYGNAAF